MVTGIGGGAGTGKFNYGVTAQIGGLISAGGSGTLTIVGQGGNLLGTGDSNNGVRITGSGSKISSGGGNISITGTEGGGSMASPFSKTIRD